MEEIRIYCENTQSYIKVSLGYTLKELAAQLFNDIVPDRGLPVLAALVDNKLKSLDYKIINPHNVRFIGYDHPDGRRTYIRSLCFVLQTKFCALTIPCQVVFTAISEKKNVLKTADLAAYFSQTASSPT